MEQLKISIISIFYSDNLETVSSKEIRGKIVGVITKTSMLTKLLTMLTTSTVTKIANSNFIQSKT